MIRYKCPQCGATMESPESQAGQSDKCPQCGHKSPVPNSTPPKKPAFMILAIKWLWRWSKPMAVGGLTLFVTFRFMAVLQTRHLAWYDTIIFLLAMVTVSGTGAWYAFVLSPRLAPTAWCLLLVVPVVAIAFSGMCWETSDDDGFSSMLANGYWWPMALGFIAVDLARKKERRRTFCDKVNDLFWHIDTLSDAAVNMQQSAETVRSLQEARHTIFRLTGMTSLDDDEDNKT